MNDLEFQQQVLDAKSPSFCVRPFVHSLIETDGTFKPCCRANVSNTKFAGKIEYNINSDTVNSWWSSDYMNYLRSSMLSGVSLDECSRCYKQESMGSMSFRQRSNNDFGTITEPDPAPRDWEIQITNLCNLKCMMCNNKSSSSLMTENILLFGSPDTQKKYSWNESSQQEIAKLFNTLDSVVLRGGEPFMVPWIKDILEQVPESRARQIEILFNTNLTKLTVDWIPVLSKFKNIKMSCSIDAHASLLHYVRFPSTWEQVQAGLAVARMLPNANVFLNVCVQNVNILHLDKLLEWANKENLYVVLDILTEPKIFQANNLPQPLIQHALVLLENVKNKINTDLVSNLDGVIKTLHSDTASELWDKFLEHVRIKDQHRNISIAKEIPELQEYITNA
jgi:hypothetical protein